MNRAQKEERLKELILAENADLRFLKKYRESNRIEFFDIAPNPGPNPRQREILEAWVDPYYRTFLMTGSNRLGKTVLGILIGYATLFGEFAWDNKNSRKGAPTKLHHLFNHNEPRKVRYVGQDWEKHIKSVVIPELEKWRPASREITSKKNSLGIEAYWYDKKTKSSLEIMSNKQESQLHEGWSGDLIIYDEPPKRDIRIANARGLVDRRGRELFCMTLLGEAWIDREVIKKVDKNGKPDRSVFHVDGTMYDNMNYGITREGIEEFASKLTEDEYQVRILGRPAYLSGIIYQGYARKIHLRDRFEVPFDWPVDIAIDVHPREKQAILFQATDQRQDKYLVQELWDHGDAKWIGESIVRAVTRNNYRVNRVIIDPLSRGDGNNRNTMFEIISKILYPYNIVLEVASKDKDQGILEVKKHLKGPNNTPSLFIFDDLIRTIYEIEGYMWDKDTQKPQDKDDHFMENLYRLCLLNTKYVDMEDENMEGSGYVDNFLDNSGRDALTGY